MAKRKKNKQKYAPSPNKYLELLKDELKDEVPQSRMVSNLTRDQREQLDQQFDIRTTPICWGIPLDELMFSQFFTSFVTLVRMPWDSFVTTLSTYLPDARNEVHNQFLRDTDAPFLMMLDSDVVRIPEPTKLISKLMAHEKFLVGGWYNNKPKDDAVPHPVVYMYGEDQEGKIGFIPFETPGTGLQKVDGMGAGCWLMSRDLAEDLGESPYSMEGGTEDIVISKKIMDLGYSMWVDWDLHCNHLGVAGW